MVRTCGTVSGDSPEYLIEEEECGRDATDNARDAHSLGQSPQGPLSQVDHGSLLFRGTVRPVNLFRG